MDLSPTTTLLEALYTWGAFFLLVAALLCLQEVILDSNAADNQADEDIKSLARRNIVIIGGCVVVLTLFFIIGVRSSALPPSPREDADEWAFALGVGFIITEIYVGVEVLYILWNRNQITPFEQWWWVPYPIRYLVRRWRRK